MTKQQRQKKYNKAFSDYLESSDTRLDDILKKTGESIHRSAFRAAAKAAADHVGVEVQASATAQAILRAGRN